MNIKVLVISDYREYVAVRPEAEIFLGLVKEGFDITIMTYPGTVYGEKFREAGINVIEFHPEKKFHRPSIRRIRKELEEGGYHILHMFNSLASSNGIFAARHLPVKVLLYRGYTGNIHWYDPAIYLKYFHPRVDKIFCIAKAIENMFRKNSVFVKNKAITIAKGHHPDWYKEIRPVASFEKFGIPPGAFVITNVGNVRPMKGIPYLIKSTHLLPADKPVHLLLIGRGFDKPKIRDLINKSPIKQKIHCPGFVSDPLSLVAASDLFVLASVKGEAITKSVIEAMSLGVAPVITEIAGNADLVIHNQCGLVVPSKNPEALAKAILTLYENPELRIKMAVAAQEHIRKNLHIDSTIGKIKALYTEMADELINKSGKEVK